MTGLLFDAREMLLTPITILFKQVYETSSRGGFGGKATTMFKHSCHFSPGGSNPA